MKNKSKDIKISKVSIVSKLILVILGLILSFTCLYSFYGCTEVIEPEQNTEEHQTAIADLERRIQDYSSYFVVTPLTYEQNSKMTQVNIKNISLFTFTDLYLTLVFLDENKNILFSQNAGVYNQLAGGNSVQIYTQNFEDMYQTGVIESRVKYIYVIDAQDYYFV